MYGSVARFPLSQLLNRLHDPEPHGFPFHVTGIHQLVSPHGRFIVGCFAILLYELIGGAIDVKVGGHYSAGSNTSVDEDPHYHQDGDSKTKTSQSEIVISPVHRSNGEE